MTELSGTVVQILGKEASVRVDATGGSRIVGCYLRGKLFSDRSGDVRNQLVVGDEVELETVDPGAGDTGEGSRGVLTAIRERRTLLVRRVPGRRPHLSAIAANVDRVVVVSSLKDPPLRTGLIDRYLVIAHHAGIDAALCLNKMDLGDPEEIAEARKTLARYAELGYPTAATSARTGEGLDDLRRLLRGRRSVLAGHSGVGKSRLAQALVPGLELPSAAVDRRGKGRHTTTSALLVELEGGGELVDTPGVRELSIGHVGRDALAEAFVELRPHLGQCRFTSCSHVPEPGCAVKEAVARGAIDGERYESYRGLYEELSGA